MERFAQLAAETLRSVLPLPQTLQVTDLEIPHDPQLGDFAFPCFKLAKQLRKSPPQIAQEIAQEIAQKLPRDEIGETLQVSAVGPYVNFTVPPRVALKSLLKDILSPDTSYGRLSPGSRGTWALEFSSPNVAKPLNIYHLRTTALGAALDRIGRFRGYTVVTLNHLGDWGKQYGMLTVAFRLFGKDQDSVLTMKDLVEMYVKINAMAETDPQIEIEAKQSFLKLEQGDPKITALWKKCVILSIQEFNRQYLRLGVHFDHFWGESFYKDQLAPLLQSLKEKNILIESEGAWIVPVQDEDDKELPPCILQKGDGATIYATRDVAAAIYRYEQFHFDRMTYIVGAEQRLHFKQVFAVLKKMGFAWASHCEHVPTGLYRFKDAKMSTRKGNFVTLEEVLELAKERAITLMTQRQKAAASSPQSPSGGPSSESSDAEQALIAEAVAVGAVVFHDLHTDPVRDVEFDIDRIVNFEGETGPYLQYAHTRCLSILRKAQETQQWTGPVTYNESAVSLLQAPEELNLVKTLGQFPLHLERTLTFAKASQLAHYLLDVTRIFGSFYRECQVLGNPPELTHARLMLVEATRRILGTGLNLLGIPLPERM